MLDSKLLLTLASVIETNGFERAAVQLGITQSAVSQRIKQLESLLGQPLLIRSQPIEATSTGKTLLQHYKQIKMLELDLMQHIKPESSDGPLHILSIGADADSLSSWLMPALLPLMHQHGLQLRILLGEQVPDPTAAQSTTHLSGWLTHSSSTIYSSQCLYLGDMHYQCVCTPAYLQHRFAQGLNTTTLANAHAAILHGQHARHAFYLQQALAYMGDFPYSSLPTPEAMLTLIRAGLAYGLIPQEYLDHIADDAGLVTLGTPLQLPLYWHHWRAEPAIARALGEALLAARQARGKVQHHTLAAITARSD
ncbi:ArgP/LysG family DNA-binding transcriptional regulator [Vogesella sp. DC21W]|uniref:ArgP/LysG family DNA-binding transcriptional regulator n=1 Tax=Vogesella aquatica TaxID=2984206 RepID=A0ABT5J366_9NEIS|nr:ArgP/LysG family DNA-binding transcriptional regulator [Vogesella aquatica]MDC7718324.1 ArgP/LysG family DNA-binding transcriptional regulator [Vogesella aquatica]